HDPKPDRRVAIKLLRARPGGEPETQRQERLVREARALAQLSLPEVIQVFDVGTEGGRVFLAMEYVEGGTLGAWLQAKRREPREVLAIFRRVRQGQHAAHPAGPVQ